MSGVSNVSVRGLVPTQPALIATFTLYVLPLVVGVAGNAGIVYVIAACRTLHTGVNAYIANMAALDLLACTLLVPLRIAFYVLDADLPSRDAFCRADVFFRSVMDAGRILLLSAVSFERYQTVARPFQRDKAAAARRAVVTLAVIWVLTLLVAILLSIFFHDTIMFEYCTAGQAGMVYSMWGNVEVYVVLPLSLLTVLVVLVCYVLMFRLLYTQRQKMSRHATKATSKVSPAPDFTPSLTKQPILEENTHHLIPQDDKGAGDGKSQGPTLGDETDHKTQTQHNNQESLVAAVVDCDASFTNHTFHSGPDTSCVKPETADGECLHTEIDKSTADVPAPNSVCSQSPSVVTPSAVTPSKDEHNPRVTQRHMLTPVSEASSEKLFDKELTASTDASDHHLQLHFVSVLPQSSVQSFVEEPAEDNNKLPSPIPHSTCDPECPNQTDVGTDTIPHNNNGLSGEVSDKDCKRGTPTLGGHLTLTSRSDADTCCDSPEPKDEISRLEVPLPSNCANHHATVSCVETRCGDGQAGVGNLVDGVELSQQCGLSVNAAPTTTSTSTLAPESPLPDRTQLITVQANESSTKSVKVVEMDGSVHVEHVQQDIQGAVCMLNPRNKLQGRRRVELRVAKRLVVLFLSFLLLWLPYPCAVCTIRFLHLHPNSPRPWEGGVQQSVTDLLSVLSALTTVTAAVNPVFYGLANSNIRAAITSRLNAARNWCRPQR